VFGVVAAGLLAIPELGLWKTAALAAAIDLIVFATILVGRPAAPPAAEGATAADGAQAGAERVEKASSSPGSALPWHGWILPLFAISGFTAIL
jgi:hypothetical protein